MPSLTAPLSCSIRSVMQKYLEDRGEVTFEKIFSQKLGEYSGGSASPKAWGVGTERPGGWRPGLGLPSTGAGQPGSPWVTAELGAAEPPSPWLLAQEALCGVGAAGFQGHRGSSSFGVFVFESCSFPLAQAQLLRAVGRTDRKGRGSSCGACLAVVGPPRPHGPSL